MGTSGGRLHQCAQEKFCLEWVQKYMNDCVCSTRDEISLVLGLVSVACWAVAEVPQIITNFREQSTEGVSLAFLITWVVGDVFNLAGCYLEPSTLPTQLYMALLYTITTLILVGQVIYYHHIMVWFKMKSEQKKRRKEAKDMRLVDERPKTEPETTEAVSVPLVPTSPSAPVTAISSPVTAIPSPHTRGRDRKDLYYTSARSLASSHTPTAGSYLSGSRGSGDRGAHSILHCHSVEDSNGYLTRSLLSNSAPSDKSTILRAVVSSTLLFGGFNVHSRLGAMQQSQTFSSARNTVFSRHAARKLLEARFNDNLGARFFQVSEAGGYLGECLGWMMAAIYMGGRVPQIWLNIKRGTVEGLNPLMFTFAVLGNATYVGSILVRHTEWAEIKSNMPWLVDAGVCVALDCLILCQFCYFYWKESRDYGEENKKAEYVVCQ